MTREELAALLQGYAWAMGLELPKRQAAVRFADEGAILPWLREAVQELQMAGILQGNACKFNPATPSPGPSSPPCCCGSPWRRTLAGTDVRVVGTLRRKVRKDAGTTSGTPALRRPSGGYPPRLCPRRGADAGEGR